MLKGWGRWPADIFAWAERFPGKMGRTVEERDK